MRNNDTFIFWQKLFLMTQSNISSVRKDAVLSASSHVQSAMECIGFTFSTVSGSEESPFGRRLIDICKNIETPLLSGANVKEAVRLRNKLAHESIDVSPAECAAAVSTYRHILICLAQLLMQEANFDPLASEDKSVKKRTGLALTDDVARVLDTYNIPQTSEDAVRSAIHNLPGIALHGLEGALNSLSKNCTEEVKYQAYYIFDNFIYSHPLSIQI